MSPAVCCAIAWWAYQKGYEVTHCHPLPGGLYAVRCEARFSPRWSFWTVLP